MRSRSNPSGSDAGRPSGKPRHLIFGSRGERSAERFLRRRGHRVVGRNFTCAVGEIDLITLDGDTIVFVEVKTRASDEAADVADAAGPVKWRRVERAARTYLRQHDAQNAPARFDLVTVLWRPRGKPEIEHLEDVHHVRW